MSAEIISAEHLYIVCNGKTTFDCIFCPILAKLASPFQVNDLHWMLTIWELDEPK